MRHCHHHHHDQTSEVRLYSAGRICGVDQYQQSCKRAMTTNKPILQGKWTVSRVLRARIDPLNKYEGSIWGAVLVYVVVFDQQGLRWVITHL